MNDNQLALQAYGIYLSITIGLTIYVARTLFRNGRVFLNDIFAGNKELADSVNHLLLVGFYLVNVGYTVYVLRIADTIGSSRQMVELLSVKIGAIILILGAMHFFNLFVLFRLRRKALTPKPAPYGRPFPIQGLAE